MKLKLLITVASVGFLLTSCLKGKDPYGFTDDPGSIVSEIYSHNLGDPLVVSLNAVPNVETVDLLTVRYYAARSLKPKSDMSVTLVLNPQLVTDYNTANGTSLVVLPSSAYTLSDPSLVLTMPKGSEGEKSVTITLTKSSMNLANTYALGFTMQSASEGVVSELAKNFLFIVGVKNKYDGVYQISGTMVDVTNASFVGTYYPNYPLEWELRTAGPTQIAVYDAYDFGSGTQAHVFSSVGDPTSANTYYGSFGLNVTFDASDNVASVVNSYGQPSGNGRSANLDPSGINKYDPATKTVKIKYWMDQPAVVTPHRTYFDETWTYIRARD